MHGIVRALGFGLVLFVLGGCSQNTQKLDRNQPPPPPPPTLAEQLNPSPHGGAPTAPSSAQSLEDGVPPGISGIVELEGATVGNVGDRAVLYIIARTPGGPPVAVRRIASPSFPLRFFLGQESVMFDGDVLEGEVNLIARVSQSGSAGPAQPGDLEGSCSSNPVAVGSDTEFHIHIDEVK